MPDLFLPRSRTKKFCIELISILKKAAVSHSQTLTFGTFGQLGPIPPGAFFSGRSRCMVKRLEPGNTPTNHQILSFLTPGLMSNNIQKHTQKTSDLVRKSHPTVRTYRVVSLEPHPFGLPVWSIKPDQLGKNFTKKLYFFLTKTIWKQKQLGKNIGNKNIGQHWTTQNVNFTEPPFCFPVVSDVVFSVPPPAPRHRASPRHRRKSKSRPIRQPGSCQLKIFEPKKWLKKKKNCQLKMG